jgi:hypothetical protein
MIKDSDRGLSSEELKRMLRYDPDTGDWVWKIKKNCSTMNIGDKAGAFSKWHLYHTITINRINYRSHRLAWFYMMSKWPKNQIDHIDGNRKNNKFSNLREATNQENCNNKSFYKNNSLGIKGVSKRGNIYRATIFINGKQKHLGNYSTIDEARSVRNKAAKEAHKEFYRE